MKWYWKSSSPKTIRIMFDVLLIIFLILSVYYLYMGIAVADSDEVPFALTMAYISAGIGITLWAVGTIYWSIINKMDEWLNNGGEG